MKRGLKRLSAISNTVRSALAIVTILAQLQAEPSVAKVLSSSELLTLAPRECVHNREIRDVSDGSIYFALFIPGVLGSALVDNTDEPIWDGITVPNPKRLVYGSTTPVKAASVLRNFRASAGPVSVKAAEVYGAALNKIREALGKQAEIRTFAYDWRQPIEESARKLEASMREEYAPLLKGRRLVVVAHSMGGVVAWTWKNMFFRTDPSSYNFDWVRLIVLGSPLQGSCEMMRMLVQGYGPMPNSGIGENTAYSVFFGDLRAAALTFPSVYELLPFNDGETSPQNCLVLRDIKGTRGRNPLAEDAWVEIMPMVLRGRAGWISGYHPVSDTIDMSKNDLRNIIMRNVKAAHTFRGSFDLDEAPLRGRVTYFYGMGHPTSHQLEIDLENEVMKPYSNEDGDGRVLKSSATNEGWYADGENVRRATSSHGDLPGDDAFVEYIQRVVLDGTTKVRAGEIMKLVQKDTACRQKFVRRGYEIPLSEVTSGVEGDETQDEARRQAAADINLNRRGRNDLEEQYQYTLETLKRGEKERAIVLFESLLAEPGSKNAAWEIAAIDHYTDLLLEGGRQDEAGQLLRRADAILLAASEHNRSVTVSQRKLWPSAVVRSLYGKIDQLNDSQPGDHGERRQES